MGATPITDACDDTPAAVDELGTSDTRMSLWPPGVDCVWRSSDGMEFKDTYIA